MENEDGSSEVVNVGASGVSAENAAASNDNSATDNNGSSNDNSGGAKDKENKKKRARKEKKKSRRVNELFENEAEEDEDEDEEGGAGDEKRKKRKKDRTGDDDDDEEEDDEDGSEDENEYDLNDPFLAKDDEEEDEESSSSDESEESAPRRTRLRRTGADDLDEDDMAIMEGNEASPKPDYDIEEEEGDEASEGSFIVDDFDRPSARNKASNISGSRQLADLSIDERKDFEDLFNPYIFHDDEDEVEKDNELEINDEVDAKKGFLIDFGDLKGSYATPEDIEVANADIPERINLQEKIIPLYVKLDDDDQLNTQAKWVLEQINSKRQRQRGLFEGSSSRNIHVSLLKEVKRALHFFQSDHCEVLYVHTFLQYEVSGLSLRDLWEIYDMGFEYQRYKEEFDSLVNLIDARIPESLLSEEKGFIRNPDDWSFQGMEVDAPLGSESNQNYSSSLPGLGSEMEIESNPASGNGNSNGNQRKSLRDQMKQRLNANLIYFNLDKIRLIREGLEFRFSTSSSSGPTGTPVTPASMGDDEDLVLSKNTQSQVDGDNKPRRKPRAAYRKMGFKPNEKHVNMALCICTPSYLAANVDYDFDSKLIPKSLNRSSSSDDVYAEDNPLVFGNDNEDPSESSRRNQRQMHTQSDAPNIVALDILASSNEDQNKFISSAVKVLAVMISKEERVLDIAQKLYRDHGTITTTPTENGRQTVLEDPLNNKDMYSVLSLKNKPFRTFVRGEGFGQSYQSPNFVDTRHYPALIAKAERDKLIEVETNCKTEIATKIMDRLVMCSFDGEVRNALFRIRGEKERWEEDFARQLISLQETWEQYRYEALYQAVFQHIGEWCHREMLEELNANAVEFIAYKCGESLRKEASVAPLSFPIVLGEHDFIMTDTFSRGKEVAIELSKKENQVDSRSITIVALYFEDDKNIDGVGVLIDGDGEYVTSTAFPSIVDYGKAIEKVKLFLAKHSPHVVALNCNFGPRVRDLFRDLCNYSLSCFDATRRIGPPESGNDNMQNDDDDDDIVNEHSRGSLSGKSLQPGLFLPFFMDDSIARLYESSKQMQEEFPKESFERHVKIAIGMARYLKDPLIVYASLWGDLDIVPEGVIGLLSQEKYPYKSYISAKPKLKAYERALMDVSCFVGVDVNYIRHHQYAKYILQFLPGLGPRKVSSILSKLIRHPNEIQDKVELKELIGGSSVFKNFGGFVRIENISMIDIMEASGRVYDKDEFDYEVLDSTRIHPDWFKLAAMFCGEIVASVAPSSQSSEPVDYNLTAESRLSTNAETMVRKALRIWLKARDRFKTDTEKWRRKQDIIYKAWINDGTVLLDENQIFSADFRHDGENDGIDLAKFFAFAQIQQTMFNQSMITVKSQLRWIIQELRFPFEDKRNPITCMTSKVLFQNMYPEYSVVGTEIQVRVEVETTYEKDYHGKEYARPKYFFKLPSNVKISIKPPPKSNELNPEMTHTMAYITGVDYSVPRVEATLHSAEFVQKLRDEYWVEPEQKQTKETLTKTSVKLVPFLNRPVNHIYFQNISIEDAQKQLSEKPIGSFVFRPSSSGGYERIVCTLKVGERPPATHESNFAHISIEEKGKKKNEAGKVVDPTLSGDLRIGDEKYSSVDEIIAMYIDPIVRLMNDMAKFRAYHPGSREEVEESLKKDIERDPKRTAYYIARDLKRPPHFAFVVLRSATSRVHRIPIDILPNGFRVEKQPKLFVDLEALLKELKNAYQSLSSGASLSQYPQAKIGSSYNSGRSGDSYGGNRQNDSQGGRGYGGGSGGYSRQSGSGHRHGSSNHYAQSSGGYQGYDNRR